jgi:hypothetical protein
MALIASLPEFFKRKYLILHPSVRNTLLEKLKHRFKDEVTPEMWYDLQRSYDDHDHTAELFIIKTQDMAREIVGDYFKDNKTIDDIQIQLWMEELWDDSQSFWSELSEIINKNLNFIGTLIERSKTEIESLFPKSDAIFGEKATQFLIDLAFQSNVYDYTKVSKPHLVDMRRMLNIAGQIVEEIFSSKIFCEEHTIGEIYRKLESFNHSDGSDKTDYFRKYPNGNILLRKPFLDNLKTVRRIRDPYSHGASSDTTIEDDLPTSFSALLNKQNGVLSVLYILLERKTTV